MVSGFMILLGMRGYSDNTFVYPWNTCLYAMAACAAGEFPRARAALEAVAGCALRDGTFEECYEADRPEPVVRRFYRSERDFAWAAGLYLRALWELERASLS